MTAATMHKMTGPELLLGDTTPITVQCHIDDIALVADRDDASRRWCDKAGALDWRFEFKAKQSFGVDGYWDLIVPLDGTDVAFTFVTNSGTVTADNKMVTGFVTVVAPEVFVDGNIENGRTELDVVWQITSIDFLDVVV